MPLDEALKFLSQSEAARDKEIQDRERARRSRIRQRGMSVITLLALITLFAVWRAYDARRNEQRIATALAVAQRAMRLAEIQAAVAQSEKRTADQKALEAKAASQEAQVQVMIAQREKRRADQMAQSARDSLREAQNQAENAHRERRIADQTLIMQLLAPNVTQRLASTPARGVYAGQARKPRDASDENHIQVGDLEGRAKAANLNNAIAFVHEGNGLLHSAERNVDRAIDDYKKAIQLDRDYEPAYYQLALADEKKDDYDKAIANLDLAIGFNPKALYLAQRASAYERKGIYDKAFADYDRIIQLSPSNATYRQWRASAYEREGNFDKALADYDRMIQLSPANTTYRVQRAMAYERRGDYVKAFADYNQIIPRDSTGYVERGIGYFYDGRFVEAANEFSRALSLSSMNAYAALWLQLTRWKNGISNSAGFVQVAERVDQNAWPRPIVDLFLSKATPREVLAAAKRADAPDHRHVCEASFYIGEYALAHQNRAWAHELLSDAVSKCPTTDFFIIAGAQAELKRLGI
jgi:tetratricopeptide (TPR) repeat protein